MDEKDENKNELSVDEEAKKQFLKELKNKNMEEKKNLEEIKRKEKQEKEEQLKKAEEQEKPEESGEGKEEEHLENTKIDNIKEESNKNDVVDKKSSDEKTSDNNSDSKKKNSLVPGSLKSSIIDTAVTAAISLACLYLFDLILRLLFGCYIADMKGMFIIVFLIVLILYPVIMKSCKLRKTLGEKFSGTSKGED
ncbi:RDD family protein [Clostridium sp. JNZ X4-2]